jgi:hypothetical protein
MREARGFLFSWVHSQWLARCAWSPRKPLKWRKAWAKLGQAGSRSCAEGFGGVRGRGFRGSGRGSDELGGGSEFASLNGSKKEEPQKSG